MLTANTSEDRFETLGSDDTPRNTLSQALAIMPIYPNGPRIGWPSWPNADFYDNVEKSNEAWIWTLKRQGHPRRSTEYAKEQNIEGLRRWGYVIWDHERLQSLGILTRL